MTCHGRISGEGLSGEDSDSQRGLSHAEQSRIPNVELLQAVDDEGSRAFGSITARSCGAAWVSLPIFCPSQLRGTCLSLGETERKTTSFQKAGLSLRIVP